MPVLQPLLLVVTVALVGGCAKVCADVYARQRAGLASERTLRRWRSRVSGGTDEPTSAGTDELRRLEERVLNEVLEAPSRPLAVLALNELTHEVGQAVSDARTLPPAVGRVALLGGTALGLTAMATALGNQQGAAAAMWGGACLVLALIGAGVCGVYGKLARQAAERRRDQARELLRLLERRLPSA